MGCIANVSLSSIVWAQGFGLTIYGSAVIFCFFPRQPDLQVATRKYMVRRGLSLGGLSCSKY